MASRGMLVSPLAGTPAPPTSVRKVEPLNVRPSGGSAPAQMLPPGGNPGEATRERFDARRVSLAGGFFNGEILHPAIVPFEQLYRRLPEEGMFSPSVSPARPFSFEIGAFTVPDQMALLIFDLRPDIYRFSGVDPGDYMPVENRRFGSIMGFDITVDQARMGNIAFELDPVAIQRTSQQAFNSNNTVHPTFNAGQYAIGAAGTFGATDGSGNALQPQRPERYGALSIPFTMIARSKQTVQTRCVIFRPLPTPIAFIEYDIAGVLVPDSWMKNMLEAVKPPMDLGKESIR